MSDNLPITLKNLHDDAIKAETRPETFRAYITLMNRGYSALEKARSRAKLADRHLAGLLTDHTFFQRHKAKVDNLYRLLPDCFTSPTRVMKTIDDLATYYPAEYVFQVCRLGVTRIGPAIGWTFLGFKSADRLEAERIYAESVLPAIGEMIADHRDYLSLRTSKIEESYAEAQADATEKRKSVAAIEAAIPKWTEEMTASAHALRQSEVDNLNSEEREVRRHLMAPPKLDPTTVSA